MLVIGINHKTAALCFRELLSFSKEVLKHALSNLFIFIKKKEVALVSTCNRTEIYTNSAQAQLLFAWLEQYCGVTQARLKQAVYVYQDDQAINHLMEVACGLDSHIIGETQILGQLKYSYSLARELGTVGKQLSRLFETTFSVAKLIRASTLIHQYPVSIASLVLKKANQWIPDLSQARVLLLGAGKMSELCAEYFYKRGIKALLFANRTVYKAQQLANKYQGKAYTIEQGLQCLSAVDIVVVATGAHVPVITRVEVAKQLNNQCESRMLCLFDLAMPRNVEASVAEQSQVILYNIDELQSISQKNIAERKQVLQSAKNIIEHHVRSLQAWLRMQEHVSVIKNYRSQAVTLRDNEVNKALVALRKGGDPEKIVTLLGYQLTNKLLHQPTVALNSATQDSKQKTLAACEVLGINFMKEAD